MAAKNRVEFHESEQGQEACEKKLQNLCWAAVAAVPVRCLSVRQQHGQLSAY